MMMTTTTQKRKAVDQVNHDFSDFSLSSPATKIRRLDYLELAPIMEEDEHQVEEESYTPPAPFVQQEETPVGVGEVENEERAIVLFNPNNTIIQSSPSTFSLTPHILERLKGHGDLWSKHKNLLNNSSAQQGEDTTLEDDESSDRCLAVVPWVLSHLSPPPQTVPSPAVQIDASETMMMEDEQLNEQEVASMDIEQEECNNNGGIQHWPEDGFGGPGGVGFHQWQQQHCMVPSQLPHNAAAPTATPVVWFR
ncbi:uncharacterized protein LOC141693262 [Apium graveolens]|uniref:uncharacterized protein LOC141693262 n=1 Tax=Apium graveolens TaxID=4045 RepID=UPI003D7ADB70